MLAERQPRGSREAAERGRGGGAEGSTEASREKGEWVTLCTRAFGGVDGGSAELTRELPRSQVHLVFAGGLLETPDHPERCAGRYGEIWGDMGSPP